MTPEAEMVWDALNFRTPAMLAAVDDLTEDECRWQPPGGANPIAWMLWHIPEVEDNWIRDRLYGLSKRYPFGASVRSMPAEKYPSKHEVLEYFREVRALTRERLAGTTAASFATSIQDDRYGVLTVRQVWAGVVTSAAWHGGQIVYAKRLLPPRGI
jgi:hypothetical protein